MKLKFDCVIIGGGPAALQAGIFLGRAPVSALIIGIPEKSDLAYGRLIGNYFGFLEELPGLTLLKNGVEQNKKYKVEILEEEVVSIEKEPVHFKILTETSKQFLADNIIIATGQSYTKAGIEGEKEFLGRGVHACVACDGVFYKNKKVAVVGSGPHALQEAVELAAYTKEVTVFTQGDKITWSRDFENFAKEKGVKIQKKRIKKIKGDKKAEVFAFDTDLEEKIDGIFIAIGAASSVTFAYKLGLEQKDGFLVIDGEGKTNVEGVWAAGGCVGGNQQIAKSVGEGCNAAISVIKKTKGLTRYLDQT